MSKLVQTDNANNDPAIDDVETVDVLIAGAVSTAAASVPGLASAQTAALPTTQAAAQPPVMAKLAFKVNGKARQLDVDTRTTLLDVLRENLHMTGTKKGCDHGQCGACTVHIDGVAQRSFLEHDLDEHDQYDDHRDSGRGADHRDQLRSNGVYHDQQ